MLLVLCLALGLRAALQMAQPAELLHDRDLYLGIAQGIVAGRGYCTPRTERPTAFRPPLYPLCLAAAGSIFPWTAAVGIVNGLGTVALILGVWRTAQNLGLGSVAWLAAGLAAVDPLLVQCAGQPMTETLFTGLVALWLASATSMEVRLRGDLRTGLLFGLVVLCRPTLWPLAGLALLVLLLRRFSGRSLGMRWPWGIGLAALLVVAPWAIRNQLVFGTPILATTHGGYTLLLANNPVFTRDVVRQPRHIAWPGESLAAWQRQLAVDLEQTLGPEAGEVAQDRQQSRWAWGNIGSHPQEFLAATAYRLRSLWRLAPQGDEAQGRRVWLLRGVAGFYAIVFGLALLGAVQVLRFPGRSRWLPCLLLVITVQTVHLFYWTDARMRAPLVPVISLLAAVPFTPRAFPSVPRDTGD